MWKILFVVAVVVVIAFILLVIYSALRVSSYCSRIEEQKEIERILNGKAKEE